MGKGNKVTGIGSVNDVDKANWTPTLVNMFCDACAEEIECGVKPHHHFTKSGWKNVLDGFNKRAEVSYNRGLLKNKWDNLKKDYLLWKELIGKDIGNGWDSIKKSIDADDSRWKQKNTFVTKFQQDGIELELHDKLGSMFSSFVATGAWAWTPSSVTFLGEGMNRIEVDCSVSSADNDEDFDVRFEEINVDPKDIETTHGKRKKSTNSTQLTS
ncbi:Myb_DNA-bind_3 domain-containing protein [Cephalotus follicularis]|uniref:Myb_DNA-bind_3 domain-containing protein n=1 Tax=Cephalotus follicularis TaxID=3775 RepID=A0A1Q3D355_CEPFO|nr:Myb_DNA-bind_3 domain-containing protein [Cephalotus follicularis]